MNVSIRLADPKKLAVNVQLTSTIEELEALTALLPYEWPAYQLREALCEAIQSAKKTFYGESNKE